MADYVLLGLMGRTLAMSALLVLTNDALAQQGHRIDADSNQQSSQDPAQLHPQIRKLLEDKRYSEAKKRINQHLTPSHAQPSVPLLRLRAELFNRTGDFVDEAATYHDLLTQLPDDKEALRGRAFAVLRMGAPQLALEYANRRADVFSRSELLQFRQAGAGRSIRWGGVEEKAGIGRQRFQSTDSALKQNERVRRLHRSSHEVEGRSSDYADFDRIVALRDRVRMEEAIALFEALKARNGEMPAYALAAAADAYLYRRQPHQARTLYLQALKLSERDPDYPNREWQINLFNAYMDAFEFDSGRAYIDRLVTEIPPVLNKGLRGVEVDNEFYEDARIQQVYARLWADRLEEGQAMLDRILEKASFNTSARTAYADLLQLRDQPRAAQRKYASVLVDDPANSKAAMGIAETALALHDGPTAKHHLAVLTAHYPESREVQRLEQLYRLYQRPLLTVTSGWGNSPTGGGTRGTQNWQADAFLHSPLLDQQWRLFLHTFNAEADFSDVVGVRRRVGMGAEVRRPGWRVSGEVNQDQDRLDHYGAALSGGWMPDDHWEFELAYESNSNNIPLQASAAGIEMQSLGLGMDYSVNEAVKLSANLAHAWFSDGNRRLEGGANWRQRWWSGPVYKLDTTVGAFASNNTLLDAAYFNPRQDLSVEAQIDNEWTVWRDYRRSFKNRLILGIGNYWQKRFAAGVTSLMRYEHEWNLDPYRTISYGAAYERHPYDGVTNETTSVFLNLTWHL